MASHRFGGTDDAVSGGAAVMNRQVTVASQRLFLLWGTSKQYGSRLDGMRISTMGLMADTHKIRDGPCSCLQDTARAPE